MASTTKPDTNSIRKWFFKLIRKPVSEATVTPQTKETLTPQEDSVAQDLQKVKTIFEKINDNMRSFITPFAKKSATSATHTAQAVRASVDNNFLGNLVRTFLILFFSLVLVFIAIYLFRKIKSDEISTEVPSITTTPPPFEPFKPSVYAQDPEVLKIEEDVNILERELNQTKIREEGINPPSLDFDISF